MSLNQQIWLHYFLAFAWMLSLPIGLFVGWEESIAFLFIASVYANVAGEWATARAIKAEKRQVDEQVRQLRMEESIDEIYKRIVK